jgi:Leucine-rich repeat (LRR) protein
MEKHKEYYSGTLPSNDTIKRLTIENRDDDLLEISKKYPNIYYLLFFGKSFPKGHTITSDINNFKDLHALYFHFYENSNLSFNDSIYLKNLKILYFTSRVCKNIPSFVYKHKNLIVFSGVFKNKNSIDNNQFKNLKNLEYLDLSFHKIREIPTSIYSCNKIRYLSIYSERGKGVSFTSELTNLNNLEELWITTNLNAKNIEILSNIKSLKKLTVNNIKYKDIDLLKNINFIKSIYFMEIKSEKKKKMIQEVIPQAIIW